MKNILILLAVAALSFSSCGDFLEEVSKDQIVPTTVQHHSELLYGEVYNKRNNQANGDIHPWLDAMTDDCEDWAKTASMGADTRIEGFGYFAWQAEPEMRTTGVLNTDNSWAHYYHQILMCNIILYSIDKMEGGQNEKMQLKAECHMVRAYAYFMLVNLYGEPYDPATAQTAPGVPINDLVGPENKYFKRESVARIYEVITEDIGEAMTAFDKTGGVKKTKFRWNRDAANVFASRVALYLRNWDDVIKYATDALVAQPKLWNLEEKNNLNQASFFLCKENPEILFSFGYYYVPFYATGAKGAFPTSASLKAIFTTGDLRYGNTDGHFIRNQGQSLSMFGGGKRYVQYKFEIEETTRMFGQAIRNAEALLNRAEAYANKPGELQKAVDDLNTLRAERIKAANYTDLVLTTQEDLLLNVKDERRRELCYEQHRWFDLRRWGCPEITHNYTPVLGNASTTVKYVLKKNDPAYTLSIPKTVLEKDPLLIDNPRPVRNPE